MTPPRRRFTVEIQVSGDDWDDVVQSLRFLLPHVEDHGPACSSVSGGSSSSHVVTVIEDKEMTHAKYAVALDQYVEGLKEFKS